ncbi:hypothetical protein [Flexivirga alba]|uniref:Uncharacterized protein n=1 Tax=Flexivirga alba TaxID=702742 RepID=A0ABW2AHN0_9MICO
MTRDPQESLRAQRVVELLEHNIRTEIDVQLGMAGRDLPDDLRMNLVQGISAEILYAFEVDWDPKWVKAGEIHAWQVDDSWYARCGVCLLDSPASPTRDQATRWATTHQLRHEDEYS